MEEFEHNQSEASSVIKSIMVEQEEKNRELLDPLVVVSGAVNALKDREREVLVARFGLSDGKKMTLEAVGQRFNVTRERVRQIETSAIIKLAEKPSKDLTRLLKIIAGVITETGGIVSLDGLARYFKLTPDQRYEAELNALRLSMALDKNVVSLPKIGVMKMGWVKKNLSDKLVEKILIEVEKILASVNKPIAEEEIWTKFSSVSETIGQPVTPSMLAGVLRVGAKLAQTPDEKWGLTIWPTVVPKRIRDKIYLILQKTHQPMHFRDISDAINQRYPDKLVLSRTVHNELIGDARFVLVGRGIYGLKEWGYQPGVVADVIMKIMKEAGRPLTVEEVSEAVLKDRQVKRNTVVANLQNKKLFQKVGKGTYVPTTDQQ
jgi:hypothetical protein